MSRVHFRKREGLTLCGIEFVKAQIAATGDVRLVTCQRCRYALKRRKGKA